MNGETLSFRAPSCSRTKSTTTTTTEGFTAPTTAWISGKWHVHQSSLPMWRSRRNVKITYRPVASPPGSFDNLVESQRLDSDKVSTVKGVEKPDASTPGAWNWRGKGWLKIAASRWEVLGWGEEGGGWMVIFFQKTLFTPAGVDLLARRKEGVGRDVVEVIKERIKTVEDEDFRKCADEMFEVKHDG